MTRLLKLLIVEGNTKEAREHAVSFGMLTQSDNYVKTLRAIRPDLEIDVIFPTDGEVPGQEVAVLTEYDGIIFTGSSLHAYATDPEVTCQVDLMKQCFEAGAQVFGSCWGMQVAVVAAGGTVEPNKKGREIGVARGITVTARGNGHALFSDKTSIFDAVAIHLDHVSKLPAEAEVLASNEMSEVQAIEMKVGTSEFWGVQYHPEFDLGYIAGVFQRYADMMLDEKFARSPEDLGKLVDDFRTLEEHGNDALAWRYNVQPDVLDFGVRTREIANWLAKVAAVR